MQVSIVGSVENPVNISNEIFKIRDGFETLDTDLWDVVTDNGDIVEVGGNTAGSGYLKISKSPLVDNTETSLLSKFLIKGPFRAGLSMSLSQRLSGQRFSFELVAVDDSGNVVANFPSSTPIAITSIQQATTTLTVVTATPHGLVPGDRISTYGVSDSRMNFTDLIVATIISATSFTVTNNTSGAITSLTIGPFVTGFVVKVDPLNNVSDAYGVFWEGTSASNAKVITRANNGAFLAGSDTSFGSNHTNATVGNNNAFADSFQPAYMYDIRYKNEGILTRTFPIDSVSAQGAVQKRSQVIPDISKYYKIRIRANNLKDNTRIVAKIISATKSASTTATIVTDVPHNLTTGDFITLYGMRDQTNFANLTTATAVASVINPTTFTIAFGASYTGVSYGGLVIRHTSSAANSAIPQSVQSISRTGNLLTLVGNTTWTGCSYGDTVQLHGLYDTAGNPLPQYEGAYKVANLSTTSLVLYSVGADFGSINCGGGLVKRSDLRLHFLRVFDYTRHTVDIDAGNGSTTDNQEAIPVAITTSATIATSGGAAAHDAAISGNPVRLAGRALSANYATVSTGDVADLVTTLVGALVQKPFSIPEGDFTYACASPVINTTDVVLKAAGAAGIRNYLTGLQVKNTNATATEIVIKDGSTVIWRGHCNANMAQHDYIDFPTPLRTTAATALNFACITTAASVYVNAQGYQAP